MSDRSHIGLRQPDGSIVSIYCHADSAPRWAGATLLLHYRDEEKVRALIALGGISNLGREIGERNYFGRGFDQDVVRAYGRDRGDVDNEPEVSFSAAEYAAMQLPYLYLFRDGRWYFGGANKKSPRLTLLTPAMTMTTGQAPQARRAPRRATSFGSEAPLKRPALRGPQLTRAVNAAEWLLDREPQPSDAPFGATQEVRRYLHGESTVAALTRAALEVGDVDDAPMFIGDKKLEATGLARSAITVARAVALFALRVARFNAGDHDVAEPLLRGELPDAHGFVVRSVMAAVNEPDHETRMARAIAILDDNNPITDEKTCSR